MANGDHVRSDVKPRTVQDGSDFLGTPEIKAVLARKPTNGEQVVFPYPYDTDLHWLWGWGARIKARVDDDRPANEFDWMVFRPDSSARDAMMRFSLQFPHVIKQVEDYLDFVERCYEEFSKAPGDAQSENCVGAMDDLQRRIETAAATIASATKPLQTPAEITADEANIRARKALKGKPPKGKLWSVRKLAKAIGCSTGTATNLPAYQAYAKDKGIKRADVPKPKAVAFTRAVEAQAGAEDYELQRLIAEQAADLEPSPLTAPSHRRRGRRKQL